MRISLLIISLLLLTACEDHPLPPPPQPLTFTGTPYRFNVSHIDVDQDYFAPRRPPHVDHLADISPSQAVRQWALSQAIAVGRSGRLEINIKDASVVMKDLPKQKHGLESWLYNEQTEEYNGTLDVELKLYDPRKVLPIAHAEAVVHQTRTLSEDSTLEDRKALYHQMTIDLMSAMQRELNKNIRLYFSNYLM